ncbi:APC family permease [Sphingomonas bacterium]|uniref:APC family permease n=1 Tax=Sphingomonas bacterium TaxID=1895847 RepID=UPI0015776E3A|nr:amino acid permease [Sphingomonas bacterium]
MATEPRAGDDRLRRSLRPAGVLALTLAALSPAGSVYVTGAAVLHLAGTGAAIAMLGGGGVVMVSALLYAELGSAFPHAGGVYHGIGEVLGPRCRAAALVLGIVTAPALIAFVALGFAVYAREVVPSLPILPLAIAAIGVATVIGVLRLRTGMWVTGTLVTAEVAALLALIVLEWRGPARTLGTVLLHPVVAGPHGGLAPTGTIPLILGTIAAAYACSGSNLALNFAEEIEGDRRVVGRVVVWGSVLAIALVALPIVGVAVGTPDLAAMLSSPAPIAASVRTIAGPVAVQAFAAIVAIAILDHVAGATIAYSRFVFAAARSLGGADGPSALSRLGQRSGAPVTAALLLGGAAILLTMVGERGLLLLISGELITPALMVVAVLVGRRRGQTGKRSFRSPFYPALPWVGLAILAMFVATDLLDATARCSIALLVICAGIAAAAARPATRR